MKTSTSSDEADENSALNMSQANHLTYSARMRGRSKQPVYTSDKRAKFTQRENKKWVRFVTVLGYIISVSLPAISLSFYYIYVWDPGYITKFPAENTNRSIRIHKTPILPVRDPREVSVTELPQDAVTKILTESTTSDPQKVTENRISLDEILKEGLKSMESSADSIRATVK